MKLRTFTSFLNLLVLLLRERTMPRRRSSAPSLLRSLPVMTCSVCACVCLVKDVSGPCSCRDCLEAEQCAKVRLSPRVKKGKKKANKQKKKLDKTNKLKTRIKLFWLVVLCPLALLKQQATDVLWLTLKASQDASQPAGKKTLLSFTSIGPSHLRHTKHYLFDKSAKK